jgi:hypothetical protein
LLTTKPPAPLKLPQPERPTDPHALQERGARPSD